MTLAAVVFLCNVRRAQSLNNMGKPQVSSRGVQMIFSRFSTNFLFLFWEDLFT